MCLYPKLIKNPKYKENKKNGGVIPAFLDKRVLYVPIGCGECIECKKQKANEWKVRLYEDIKEHTNGKFVTMTISDENMQELILNLNPKPTRTWSQLCTKNNQKCIHRAKRQNNIYHNDKPINVLLSKTST